MKTLIISEETAKKLNKPIKGCKHSRKYLRTVSDKDVKVSQLYCIGCGTWFDVSNGEEVAKKQD